METDTRGPNAESGLRAATDSARSLGRLLMFASMYPAGHPRVKEAAQRALRQAQRLSAGLSSESTRDVDVNGATQPRVLSLKVRRGGLELRSHFLNLDDRETGRLHQYLRAIGVSRVHIDATATSQEVFLFATAVLEAKSLVTKASGFVEVDLAESLPASIRVEHRGFGKRILSEELATVRVMGALKGVIPDDPEALADAVDLLVPRIMEQFDFDSKCSDSLAEAGRALDEVLGLCATALRTGVESLLSSGGLLDDLPALFRATEEAVSVADNPAAMDLMIDVLKRAADEIVAEHTEDDSPVTPDPRALGFDLSLEELQKKIAEFTRESVSITDSAEQVGDAEGLSIIIQLCLTRPWRSVLEGATVALRPDRGRGWKGAEFGVLESGIVRILETRDVDLVDAILPVLMPPARLGDPDRIRRLLARTAESARRGPKSVLFWPHLVNEMLIDPWEETGRSRKSDNFQMLSRFVCGIATPDEAPVERLVSLDALRRRKLSSDVVALRRKDHFPLLAYLMRSPLRNRVGELIYQALRCRPLRWSGSQAFVRVRASSPELEELILLMLESGGRFEASPEAGRVAGSILAEEIKSLPERRRTESWIPDVLISLGVLDGGDDLLGHVLGDRLWLRSRWPKNCRLAARRAMGMRKRKSSIPS